MNGLERVAVALDTHDRAVFDRWCAFFGPQVGWLKVGGEAFTRFGPDAVATARRSAARVFLDLKYHDIPQTVAGDIAAAAELGVSLVTVHASGGPRMLAAAVRAAEERVRIVAVTLLTHLDEAELAAIGLPGPAAKRVRALARLAHDVGCGGVVCSPRELAVLDDLPGGFWRITPGIRPRLGGEGDDQRRVASASEALAAGATLLVIGRPLTQAADPTAALAALRRELESSKSKPRTPAGRP